MKQKILVCIALTMAAVLGVPLWIANLVAAEGALPAIRFYENGGSAQEFRVAAGTVDEFFREAGISRNEFDRINHAPSAMLFDGMVINLEREIEFYLIIDGGNALERIVRPDTSIEDLFRQLQNTIGVALILHDNHAMNDTITQGDTISFYTWLERHETDYAYLPYETIRNYTPRVSRGRQVLREEGVEGIEATTTSITYIGGIEASRDIVRIETLAEPIDAILDIGTGWLGSLTDVTAPDFHYYRRVRMEATAYTAGYCCTGKHPWDPWYGITASGRRVEHGIVAVDRDIIPLGTRLYVEGYGFSLAADVGGAIRGYSIDLFMYDLQDALNFGRRFIYVWILDEI